MSSARFLLSSSPCWAVLGCAGLCWAALGCAASDPLAIHIHMSILRSPLLFILATAYFLLPSALPLTLILSIHISSQYNLTFSLYVYLSTSLYLPRPPFPSFYVSDTNMTSHYTLPSHYITPFHSTSATRTSVPLANLSFYSLSLMAPRFEIEKVI